MLGSFGILGSGGGLGPAVGESVRPPSVLVQVGSPAQGSNRPAAPCSWGLRRMDLRSCWCRYQTGHPGPRSGGNSFVAVCPGGKPSVGWSAPARRRRRSGPWARFVSPPTADLSVSPRVQDGALASVQGQDVARARSDRGSCNASLVDVHPSACNAAPLSTPHRLKDAMRPALDGVSHEEGLQLYDRELPRPRPKQTRAP